MMGIQENKFQRDTILKEIGKVLLIEANVRRAVATRCGRMSLSVDKIQEALGRERSSSGLLDQIRSLLEKTCGGSIEYLEYYEPLREMVFDIPRKGLYLLDDMLCVGARAYRDGELGVKLGSIQ